MDKLETQREWEERIGNKIIEYIVSQLYMDLRFMESALSALKPSARDNLYMFSTEGVYLYYNPEHTMELFKKNDKFLKRAYLHTVLHCIYCHPWIRRGKDKYVWDIACDIAVEYMIDYMDKPSTKRIITWNRQQIYEKMKEKGIVSAAQIYSFICKMSDKELTTLRKEFITDDHSLWEKENEQQAVKKSSDIMKDWEKRARQMEIAKDMGQGGEEEYLSQMLVSLQAERKKYSYREFLEKFMAYKEEMHINPDEFDVGMYTFGLNMYNNMPLIEPVEVSEIKRIREFVICIDTSYSTSGELVLSFLKETLKLISDTNSFSKNCKLHIIQCDEKVQQDIELKDISDAEQIFKNFVIKGGGNTDFRPAFNYVNELKKSGKLKNIGGMFYFTDGKGIYPKKSPDYKTAFIYAKDYDESKVPVWAMHIKYEMT